MKEFGLPKEWRLLKRADFRSKRERTRKINTKNFTIVCRENTKGGPRIGVVASKKVGNAVTRNRIKRLVREFFRLNRGEMNRPEDMIVIARPKARVEGYAAIEAELGRLRSLR
jgi:ribonuclease P protein component